MPHERRNEKVQKRPDDRDWETKIIIFFQGDVNITSKKIKHQKFWRNAERIGLVLGGVWLGSRVK